MSDSRLIGREKETAQIRACLRAKRNVLLEGPVGVGKTHLALSICNGEGLPVFRVDGDQRYSEQKLSGWFDPPTVVRSGFSKEAFMPGPLVEAMQAGGILFINELNRLPEGVQNVLLPAIDEGILMIPRLGEVRASSRFQVIATQNPKEFVATSHLSEAILDRFELVVLDYQTEEEEVAIVRGQLNTGKTSGADADRISKASVRLVRLTRDHPRIRRGASVRAALSIAQMTRVMVSDGLEFSEAFFSAVWMALPTRIEMERDVAGNQTQKDEMESLFREWVSSVLGSLDGTDLKKKLAQA